MADINKFGKVTNYKIPPESSGQQIQHFKHYYFRVNDLSGAFGFPAEFYTVSGVRGRISNYWDTGLAGQARLLVTLDDDADLIQNLVAGETISIDNTVSTQTASLMEWSSIISPAVNITDPQYPDRSAAVDLKGALSVRFTEGEPQFDAFGLLRTTSPVRLADYSFRYGKGDTATFFPSITGNASSTHLENEAAIAIDVTSAGGDGIKFTTNNYHTYTPGISQLAVMTVGVGDEGKDGVVRRWGYYDDNDGLFFELDDNELWVVRRTSTSGTPVDIRTPRNQWSGDQLDGSGDSHNLSLMDLNLSNINIYWIDLQWLGAGRVRYGVFTASGERLLCHAASHANGLSTPYMSTATLPVRIEQFNKTITASPSRLKMVCASVFSEGEIPEDYKRNQVSARSYTFEPKAVTGSDTVICVFRAATLFNGKDNRVKTVPKSFNYYVTGGPVKFSIQFNSILAFGGGDWVQVVADSPVEVNQTAVAYAPGVQLLQQFVGEGTFTHNLTEEFNSMSYALNRGAGPASSLVASLHAQCLNGGTATVVVGVDWMDV